MFGGFGTGRLYHEHENRETTRELAERAAKQGLYCECEHEADNLDWMISEIFGSDAICRSCKRMFNPKKKENT